MSLKAVVLVRHGRDVTGHRVGCGEQSSLHSDDGAPLIIAVHSREEARAVFNDGLDEKVDGWYDIDWAPCATDVPITHTDESEHDMSEDLLGTDAKPAAKKAAAKKPAAKKAAAPKKEAAPKPAPLVVGKATVKQSRVRTSITVGDTLAAYFLTADLPTVKAGKGTEEKRGKIVFTDLHDAFIVKEYADDVKKALAAIK